MGDKCIVKGCGNRKSDGMFVGSLCLPCHRILTRGELIPSESWFVKEITGLRAALISARAEVKEAQSASSDPTDAAKIRRLEADAIKLRNELRRYKGMASNCAANYKIVTAERDGLRDVLRKLTNEVGK